MTTIETLLIDVSTGETIGQADMPIEWLPQSFALETTMHIGDEDWQVVKAEPMTSEEFSQTGKLVLTLRKVVKVPVKDILYTLPTLCDEIPKLLLGSTKKDKNVLEIHEDDWRQIEFISSSYRSVIDLELAYIKDIYREASVDNGRFLAFKNLHLRQQIKSPLREEISSGQFTDFFTSALSEYEGISYQGTDGLIGGGFAYKTSAALFYGQQIRDMIKVLGVQLGERVPGEHNDIAHSLQRFMATYNLYLVDWCRTRLITANAEEISKFLGS